jgi:hypothetical protein
MKTRMQGHIQDVKKLFIDGKSSDSFATHFASLVSQGTAKTVSRISSKSR